MSMGMTVLFLWVVGLLLGMVLLSWFFRGASSMLHPLPRDFAHSLSEQLYELLISDGEALGCPHLLAMRPNTRERRALVGVVASLSRNVAECRVENVQRVVEAWGLEEVAVGYILRHRGRHRLEMLEWLLWLRPSEECVRRVVRRPFATPQALLGQLLLVVYASPERVMESLTRHTYNLSWEEVGRVVEVLKMHSPMLPCYSFDGYISTNAKMLALRLASVEGVGDAEVLARHFAQESDRVLRNSAMNVLLELSLFPLVEQSDVGC